MHRRDSLLSLAAAAAAGVGTSIFPVLPARAASDTDTLDFTDNDQVQAFITYMQQQHKFVPAELTQFFSRLKSNPKVLRLFNVPEKPDTTPRAKVYWQQYRRQRITPKKIATGIRFYNEHRDSLRQAEQTYYVPATIITAIIGIETHYGKYTGKYPVAQTLATLAFGHPQRGEEFREELAEFLLYAREARLDPLTLFGSYAGAMGIGQFMPSSMRKFAVDSDGDTRSNPFSAADTIASIGNFLHQHGWADATGITYPARVSSGDARRLIEATRDNDYKPLMTYADLQHYGVTTAAPAGGDGRYLFIDLENRYADEYRVGTVNFYALTRYNKSFKYAAVVTDLADTLRQDVT